MSRYLTKKFDPSDLLPCPFCGGEAEWRDGSSTKPYIRCRECGMRTGGSYACDKLKAKWNRRATHDGEGQSEGMTTTEPLFELFEAWAGCDTHEHAIAAAIGDTCRMTLLPDEPTTSIQPARCTACGHKTYAQLPCYCPHCGRRVVE